MGLRLTFNAPVVLGFCLIAFIVSIVSSLSIPLNYILSFDGFSVLNPLKLATLLTYPFAHADFSHLFGNLMFLLLLGPILEEKYGSGNLALMLVLTAALSGVVMGILPGGAVMGASGIVFMFIMLVSITGCRDGEIPVTLILVALVYLGQEILNLMDSDNVSQLGHLLGGVFGIAFGFIFKRN
jgi:membrane associated rhomboid family serine protease